MTDRNGTSKKPSASIAIITGASAGIGAACAESFYNDGWHLALGARRFDRLQDLAAKLQGSSSGSSDTVTLGSLDVCSKDSIESFKALVEQHHSGLDRIVLVNNAGLACGTDTVETGKDDDWSTMIETNVAGLLRTTRAFIPLLKSVSVGHIINIGSIAGHQTYPGGAVYAGTKHMVRAITGALRFELLETSIRVSSIDPGLVETEFSKVRLKDEQKAKKVYEGMQPLEARDIAECVVFAASRPPHVNIDQIMVMPKDQAHVLKVHRQTK